MAEIVVKRALLIAFHFPPACGSSGPLRTVKFAEFLPQHGWDCHVFTASAHAYPARSAAGTAVPTNAAVTRSLAFDAQRHFAIAGRYPRMLGRPDRWGSWYVSAIPRGMQLIRRFRPDLLWATFPIATAARIGVELARRSGLPLVCDLRDPMTEEGFPEDPRVRTLYRALEERVVAQASRIVFTAPGTLAMYRARYPAVAADHWHLIGNGYDERDFSAAATRRPARDAQPGRLELLHSGIIYPLERDPRPLFAAIAALKRDGTVDANSLRVTLRQTGHDAELQPLIDATGIGDVVKLAAPLPYHDALAEMSQVDGLLLLQAANCNQQIPAKLYEYLRAQRPILALTDADGDTADEVRAMRGGAICDLADVESIRAGLREFLHGLRSSAIPVADLAAVRQHSRQRQAETLARLFDDLTRAR